MLMQPELFRVNAIETVNDSDFDSPNYRCRLIYIIAVDENKARELFKEYYPDLELQYITRDIREVIIQEGVYFNNQR